MTQPSVGRVVHYVSAGSTDGKYPSTCRAATIVEVGPESEDHLALAEVEHWDEECKHLVGLVVLNPEGLHFRPLAGGGVRYDPNGAPYTWHWPERV